MPQPFFDPIMFGLELVFTIAAFIFCVLIFYKTREIYNLTKHKGIRYFRDAFLFFGLSYVLRFLFSIILVSRIAFDFILPRYFFMPTFILIMGYFSTMAIFYIIFSSVWKNFDNRILVILGHSVSILLSVICFLTESHMMLFFLQLVLLIIAAMLILAMRKDGKKSFQTKGLYLLTLVLWLINLFITGGRQPHFFEIGLFFQIISLIVFAVIYIKVSKWTR